MEGPSVFISNPTAVLQQYLSSHQRDKVVAKTDGFYWGRLAMALEILTQMKIVQSLPFTDLTIQLESAYQSLLVDQGMMDEAQKWYERLDAWRAPRFVAETPSRGTRGLADVSSTAASLEGSLPRTRRLRASLLGRRGQGGDMTSDATSSSGELPDGED
jgi:hypothetical protein